VLQYLSQLGQVALILLQGVCRVARSLAGFCHQLLQPRVALAQCSHFSLQSVCVLGVDIFQLGKLVLLVESLDLVAPASRVKLVLQLLQSFAEFLIV